MLSSCLPKGKSTNEEALCCGEGRTRRTQHTGNALVSLLFSSCHGIVIPKMYERK